MVKVLEPRKPGDPVSSGETSIRADKAEYDARQRKPASKPREWRVWLIVDDEGHIPDHGDAALCVYGKKPTAYTLFPGEALVRGVLRLDAPRRRKK